MLNRFKTDLKTGHVMIQKPNGQIKMLHPQKELKQRIATNGFSKRI